MSEKNYIDVEELKGSCELSDFNFSSTDELEPFEEGIIGQNRAVEAVDFGLNVEKEGYNIFMTGLPGTGKSTFAKKATEDKSKDKEIPPDLCYVYNFENSEKPQALKLPPGTGKKLKKDMEQLIEELKEEIPAAFEGEEYEEKKNQIMSEYQKKSNRIMEEFEKKIQKDGYALKNTPQGPVPVPIDEDGNPLEQEDYQKLSEELRRMTHIPEGSLK